MNSFTGITPVYSRRIVFFTGLIYLLNYIMGGKLFSLFLLDPASLVNQSEFWRLFTYPLAPGSIEAVLLFGFTFYFIGPRLEEILDNSLVPVFFVLLIFLYGIIHTLVFWGQDVQLAGFEGLSFLILVSYSLMERRNKIKLWFMPPLRPYLLTTTIFFVWAIIKGFEYVSGNEAVLVQSASSVSFGLVMAVLVYFQVKLVRKLVSDDGDEFDDEGIDDFDFDDEEFEEENMAPVHNPKNYSHLPENRTEKKIELVDDPDVNEEILDGILDKITEYGKDSLTPSELKFLEDYSNSI